MKQPQYGGCESLSVTKCLNTLFQQSRRSLNMDTNKVSNIFKYLKDKYGEDSVKQLRNGKFLVKKMVHFRNHRHFTLKCIKGRITPVS